MRKTTIVAVGICVLSTIAVLSTRPVFHEIALLMQDQKKRDSCYAIGVANLPSGEDQTMLQGSQAYQECLSSH